MDTELPFSVEYTAVPERESWNILLVDSLDLNTYDELRQGFRLINENWFETAWGTGMLSWYDGEREPLGVRLEVGTDLPTTLPECIKPESCEVASDALEMAGALTRHRGGTNVAWRRLATHLRALAAFLRTDVATTVPLIGFDVITTE